MRQNIKSKAEVKAAEIEYKTPKYFLIKNVVSKMNMQLPSKIRSSKSRDGNG
jgi:hypothetical protein